MPITANTLSIIQAAGESIHAANQALQAELQASSRQLMDQMAVQPFGEECDRAYQQMRQVARLSQEVNSLEQQLKGTYLEAAQLAQSAPAATQVLKALPSARGRQSALASTATPVEVIEIKEVKVAPSAKRKAPKQAKASKAEKPVPTQKSPLAVERRVPNAQRLLSAFKALLGTDSKPVTHAELAKLSGLPLGSVTASIQKLLSDKKLALETDGVYRLI